MVGKVHIQQNVHLSVRLWMKVCSNIVDVPRLAQTYQHTDQADHQAAEGLEDPAQKIGLQLYYYYKQGQTTTNSVINNQCIH